MSRKSSTKESTGSYGITSRGIEASAPNLGAAISKAITYATELQLSGELEKGDVQSIYVRKLGGEIAARVDVKHDFIEAFALVPTR